MPLACPPFGPELDLKVLDRNRPFSSALVEPLLKGRAIDQRAFDIDRPDATRLSLAIVKPTVPSRPHLPWASTGCKAVER